MTTQLEGQEEAQAIAQANMSPRYKRLDTLERWANGTQYVGKCSWWDDSVPLWEREPCIVYPVVKIAAQSNTDLTLGNGKFPQFSIGETGKADDADCATTIEAGLESYHRLSRFPAHSREAFMAAQECGTVVAIHGARNGLPFADLIPAKWATATYDSKGELSELVIQYPYLDEYKRPDGKWAVRAMLYRREIGPLSDTVFKPAVAQKGGQEPSWVKDPTQSTEHGLGFVPAVWYAFMRGCQPVNVQDGKAIHQWVTDEIQAHDIARSQWFRSSLLSEPQIIEIGVQPGYSPTSTGRTALVAGTERGGPATPDNPIVSSYVGGDGPQEARKKGPGYVWQYGNPDAKIEVLTTPADALKAQQDNCSDLREKIQEALCVVFLDPSNIKFAATTSGKALEAIKQKQLDRCDQYRDDFRDGFLVPSVIIQFRIAKKLGAQLKVPAMKEALAAIGSVELAANDVDVKWGDYFKPDPAEQQAIISMVQAALKGTPLVTMKDAVQKIAPIFNITDIDAAVATLEADAKKRQEDAMAAMTQMGTEPGEKPGKEPPDAKDKPKAPPVAA